MINIKNYILIFNIIIFSCTVAPRYNSVGNNVGLYNDGKSDSNKSTKKK